MAIKWLYVECASIIIIILLWFFNYIFFVPPVSKDPGGKTKIIIIIIIVIVGIIIITLQKRWFELLSNVSKLKIESKVHRLMHWLTFRNMSVEKEMAI